MLVLAGLILHARPHAQDEFTGEDQDRDEFNEGKEVAGRVAEALYGAKHEAGDADGNSREDEEIKGATG